MVEERPPPRSTSGTVVLDIGGHIGAAVVYTPAALLDQEIEVRAAGAAWAGRHVAVHRRDLPGGARYAAVFPDLTAGSWELRRRGDSNSSVVGIEITGGNVTTAVYRLPTRRNLFAHADGKSSGGDTLRA